jgi:hypothetical protein
MDSTGETGHVSFHFSNASTASGVCCTLAPRFNMPVNGFKFLQDGDKKYDHTNRNQAGSYGFYNALEGPVLYFLSQRRILSDCPVFHDYF